MKILLRAAIVVAFLASAPLGEPPPATGITALVSVQRLGLPPTPPIQLAVLGNAVRLQDEPSSYLLRLEEGGLLLRVFPAAGIAILLPAQEGAESSVPRFMRFLLPGNLWDRFQSEGRLTQAEEESLAGRTTLVVPSPDATWEERGLRHIYWLDTELHVPLRLEIHSRGQSGPDVVSLEEISAPPDPEEMLPPEGVSLYSLARLDPAAPPTGPDAPYIPPALEGMELRQLSVLVGPADEAAGFRAFYRTEDARRFLSVVWAVAGRPDLLDPLESLQSRPAPGWRLETPGWIALISTNQPRPKVSGWLAPPPRDPPEEEEPTAAAAPRGGFRCTTVVGFSQTRQWFAHQGLFESLVGDDAWQLVWLPGAAVEKWADPEFAGWAQAPESPCLEGSDSPDRVILNISGADRSVVDWASALEAALATARERHPKALVLLQPVVGAPTTTCLRLGRRVRAAANQPVILQALGRIHDGPETGPVPMVADCSGYRDPLGHLTTAALPALARYLGAYYAPEGAN